MTGAVEPAAESTSSGKRKLTRQEVARLGGQALSAKVSNAYFAFIGKRGGRTTMAHQFRDWAQEEPDQELAEHFHRKADRWAVPTGTRIMLTLWLKENCEPLPHRRRPHTWDARLRRWQKEANAKHDGGN